MVLLGGLQNPIHFFPAGDLIQPPGGCHVRTASADPPDKSLSLELSAHCTDHGMYFELHYGM